MASRATQAAAALGVVLVAAFLAVMWVGPSALPKPTHELVGTAVTTGGLDWTRVDAALLKAVERVPNTSARMRVERAGEVIYDRRLGVPKKELVPTGSVRKWTTAAALMVLVERGDLDLDDPVARYIKAYQVPDKQSITVRQTLAHTSGIVMRPPPGFCRGLGTLGACVAKSAQLPLLHEPGSHFFYSTMAFNVAARVAEQIVQKPWHRFWREVIGEPLEMKRSAFVAAGPGLPEMPGMLVTSPEEFSNFLSMVLADGVYDGQRILSAESVHEIEAGQTGGVPHRGGIPKKEWWTPGEDFYGLGVWRNLLFEDGSPRLLSAEGKHGFVAFVDREHDVSVVLSMQYGRFPVPPDVRIDPVDVIYVVCDILADAKGPNPEPNPHCLPHGRAGEAVGSTTF